MNRTLHVINLLLAAALIGGSLYVYPELPERIPVHFGADGTPDGWARRSLLIWMLASLIGLGCCALLYTIGWYGPRKPRFINVPDRKRLLELPVEAQRWVLEAVSTTMYAMTTVLLFVFGAVQYSMYQAALTGSGGPHILTAVLLSLVVSPIIVIASSVAVQRRLDSAHRAWRTGRDFATASD